MNLSVGLALENIIEDFLSIQALTDGCSCLLGVVHDIKPVSSFPI
jgi:hypothetical protein